MGGKLDLALLRQDHDDWLTPMFERTDLPYNTSENQPKGTVRTSLAVKCFRTRYIDTFCTTWFVHINEVSLLSICTTMFVLIMLSSIVDSTLVDATVHLDDLLGC